MKRVKYIRILFFVLFPALLGYLLPMLPYFQRYRDYYDRMYCKSLKAEIKEIVTSASYTDHAILIRLKNGKSFLYTAILKKEQHYEYHDLVDAAEKGDSLIKEKGNYFFFLKKKNGEVYRFDLIDRTENSRYYKKLY